MCKSTAEGGQRCAAHTRDRLQKQAKRLQDAIVAGPPITIAKARQEWEEAAAEYASTAEGHAVLSKQAESLTASGDVSTAAMLQSVIMRGEVMRMANQDSAALIKAATLTQLPATGIDATESGFIKPSNVVATKERGWANYQTPNTFEEDRHSADTPVPALRPEEQEQVTAIVTALEALDDNIYFRHVPAREVAADLRAAETILASGSSDDTDLARSVRLVGNAQELFMTMPNPRSATDPSYAAQDGEKTEGYKNIDEVWRPVKTWGPLKPQVKRALLHPGAGPETFEAARDRFPGVHRFMSGLPTCPSETLDRLVWENHDLSGDPSLGSVSAAGWERARKEAPTSASMTAALALGDPDTRHRLAAVERLTTTAPLVDIARKDRRTLAFNLSRISGDENQKTLAVRLADHVREHGTDEERAEMRHALIASKGAGAEKAAGKIRLSTERRRLFK